MSGKAWEWRKDARRIRRGGVVQREDADLPWRAIRQCRCRRRRCRRRRCRRCRRCRCRRRRRRICLRHAQKSTSKQSKQKDKSMANSRCEPI